jgi:hypothetical protein
MARNIQLGSETMAEITLVERTPEAKRAYAAGLRMACEIIEWRLNGAPWWLGPFKAGEARQAIASLRQSADLIRMEAEGEHCPATAPSDQSNGGK